MIYLIIYLLFLFYFYFFYFYLVSQNLNNPVLVLNKIFNDKQEVSLLKNKDHLDNLIKSQPFSNKM